MCFYLKDVVWHDKETEQCNVTSVPDNDETGHISENLLLVKKAWSYKKKLYFMQFHHLTSRGWGCVIGQTIMLLMPLWI